MKFRNIENPQFRILFEEYDQQSSQGLPIRAELEDGIYKAITTFTESDFLNFINDNQSDFDNSAASSFWLANHLNCSQESFERSSALLSPGTFLLSSCVANSTDLINFFESERRIEGVDNSKLAENWLERNSSCDYAAFSSIASRVSEDHKRINLVTKRAHAINDDNTRYDFFLNATRDGLTYDITQIDNAENIARSYQICQLPSDRISTFSSDLYPTNGDLRTTLFGQLSFFTTPVFANATIYDFLNPMANNVIPDSDSEEDRPRTNPSTTTVTRASMQSDERSI